MYIIKCRELAPGKIHSIFFGSPFWGELFFSKQKARKTYFENQCYCCYSALNLAISTMRRSQVPWVYIPRLLRPREQVVRKFLHQKGDSQRQKFTALLLPCLWETSLEGEGHEGEDCFKISLPRNTINVVKRGRHMHTHTYACTHSYLSIYIYITCICGGKWYMWRENKKERRKTMCEICPPSQDFERFHFTFSSKHLIEENNPREFTPASCSVSLLLGCISLDNRLGLELFFLDKKWLVFEKQSF